MKFRLQRRQPVRRTIRELFAFHLARCAALLSPDGADEPHRIHEIRKSVKRLRALVSLVGDGLGDDRRWFDRRLRDVNRALSPVRDAEALREAFDRLVAEAEPPDALAQVRARLIAECERGEPLSTTDGRRIQRQLHRLDERWQQAELPGRGWELLADNVRRAYRRSRRTATNITPRSSTVEFHELRKHIKQTQYQWEFLQPLWPARLAAELAQIESLTEDLGFHHDLCLLRDWLDRQPTHAYSTRVRRIVIKRLERRLRQLERAACRVAPRCFAETPKGVVQRLAAYWRLWRDGPTATASPPKPAIEQDQPA
jgi:CHAD domain-containing protein